MKEIEISGAYFSKKHFKENWTQQELAIIYCKLNRWETPEEFQLGRKLSRDKVKKIMSVLTGVVPKKIWLAEWNK